MPGPRFLIANSLHAVFHGVICLLVALIAVGCDTSAPTSPVSAMATSQNDPSLAEDTPDQAKNDEPLRETWDAVFIEGAKIGYGWTRSTRASEDGRDILKIRSEQSLTIQRFDQKISQQISMESWELPDGQVLQFSSQMIDSGTVTISSQGQYENSKMLIDTTTRGKTLSTSIPWDPSWGGFFSTEQRLERKPMQPGEKRSFLALMPLFNQTGQVTFEAIGWEETETLEGKRKLLRIKGALRIGDTTIDTDTWVDAKGETIKSVMPGLKQTTYRTNKQRALAEPSQAVQFDLGKSSVVRISREIPRPHDTRQIVYRVTLANGDPAREFANGASQRVKSIDAHRAEITVRGLRPTSPQDGFPADTPPTADATQPNGFLQSDDVEVKKLADSVAGKETDPWKLAGALEQLVRDTVEVKDLSQAVATAADVARSHEGDCTEHAVLLAALCRARGIPARVAIGLVYSGPAGGFAYHMWTEAWIGKHWVPLDGTLGRGGIGAAHLKITSTNLDHSESLTAFLPVVNLLGQLEIEIVSIDGESSEKKP